MRRAAYSVISVYKLEGIDLADYFEIGKIVNTQGIKGDLRVVPMTDDPTRFELLDFVYVFTKNGIEEINIEKVWYHKKFVILKLEGIDDMTAAEKYKNSMVKIPADKALPLAEDEFYIRDIYGIAVHTEQGEDLGILEDIIQTGANDVYVVSDGKKKELLIPAIKQCIINVDVENKVMTVRLLKGLRDE